MCVQSQIWSRRRSHNQHGQEFQWRRAAIGIAVVAGAATLIYRASGGSYHGFHYYFAQQQRPKTDTLGMPHAILKDPITNMRMVDPVVNPAGDSYERSSLLLTDEKIEFYPNRALQAMLKQQDEYETQRAPESANNSVAAGCWWYNDVNTSKGAQLPEAFYCPITCDIMVDVPRTILAPTRLGLTRPEYLQRRTMQHGPNPAANACTRVWVSRFSSWWRTWSFPCPLPWRVSWLL
jgi:hypothetical protein